MKKQILFILLMLLPMVARAHSVVEIDGICYELVSKIKKATVKPKPSGEYSGSVIIPASVTFEGADYSVTRIEPSTFSGCNGLTSVTIPGSVMSIGDSVFYSCSNLTTATIPNGVTRIGNYAFYHCNRLTSVTIPNSVTSIGERAFSDCSGLTSVTIPNSVTSIGGSAFSSCSSLTSITIPNSVTSIGGFAFFSCDGLTAVHISDIAAWCKISFIGSFSNPLYYAHHLYLGEEEIKDLVIPNSVTSIRDNAFYKWTSLTSVTIPGSVTSIGNYAFRSCSGLTSITIPNSVTSIGGYAFFDCSGLTSVTMGNSVTNIGGYAFYQCSGLTSVTIPNSVTSIEERAFGNCSGLTSVTIGSGLKNIYWAAFAYCKELTDVYCLAEAVPSTYNGAFYDSHIEYATLHVPAASIDAYKAQEPWKSFKTIIGLDGTLPEEPETQKCATPTISFDGKKLVFSCATDGVEYVSEIKDVDVETRMFNDSEVQLSATYEISVYAMKAGWANSNVATATLVWDTATFTETTPEESSARTLTREVPALVTCHRGTIAVQSEADGLPVAVYATDGQLYGSSIVSNGQATVSTNLQPGSIAIVKIGDKAVKVVSRGA